MSVHFSAKVFLISNQKGKVRRTAQQPQPAAQMVQHEDAAQPQTAEAPPAAVAPAAAPSAAATVSEACSSASGAPEASGAEDQASEDSEVTFVRSLGSKDCTCSLVTPHLQLTR